MSDIISRVRNNKSHPCHLGGFAFAVLREDGQAKRSVFFFPSILARQEPQAELLGLPFCDFQMLSWMSERIAMSILQTS
jgi:hypothetical protein